jgi:hypothetical protein
MSALEKAAHDTAPNPAFRKGQADRAKAFVRFDWERLFCFQRRRGPQYGVSGQWV